MAVSLLNNGCPSPRTAQNLGAHGLPDIPIGQWSVRSWGVQVAEFVRKYVSKSSDQHHKTHSFKSSLYLWMETHIRHNWRLTARLLVWEALLVAARKRLSDLTPGISEVSGCGECFGCQWWPSSMLVLVDATVDATQLFNDGEGRWGSITCGRQWATFTRRIIWCSSGVTVGGR